MSPIPRGVRWRMLLRSLAIQGSWNYRTLLGTGFAFALLPVLRYLYGSDPEALERAVTRHCGLFNAHPYLAPMALGSVAEMEAGGEPVATVDRFKVAVRGPLGSLGDRLVWATWRPAALLLGLVVLLAGARPWIAAAVFLVTYNAGHVVIRLWGFQLGLERGKDLGRWLRDAALSRLVGRIGRANAFLVGAVLPLLALGGVGAGQGSRLWAGAGLLAVLGGAGLGSKARTIAAWVLLLATAALFAYGWLWMGSP